MTGKFPYEEIERKIGYAFKDKGLLKEVLWLGTAYGAPDAPHET